MATLRGYQPLRDFVRHGASLRQTGYSITLSVRSRIERGNVMPGASLKLWLGFVLPEAGVEQERGGGCGRPLVPAIAALLPP